MFERNETTGEVKAVHWEYATRDWWNDPTTILGSLSRKCVEVELLNTLTGSRVRIRVPEELEFGDIIERYILEWNRHARSYHFKYEGVKIDLSGSLLENGIVCESDRLLELGMNPDEFVPTIMMYFVDDLRVA
jgi:hypothetical protein